MKRYLYALFGVFLLSSLVVASQEAKPEKNQQSLTIQVQLNYSGSGAVDETHKIYVVLWDSPDFVEGNARPIMLKPATSKSGTVTFSGVQKVPAYVSAVYDPKGGWDGESGPPPSGSSLGLYSKTPGKPEPIDVAPGKTSKVQLSFDDTVKMPQGKVSALSSAAVLVFRGSFGFTC